MTTVASGPYEHTGAYGDLAESERFDISGTPAGFCPDCEHAPCVAEHHRIQTPGVCGSAPRLLTVGRVSYPIYEAGRSLEGQALQIYQAMAPAVYLLDTLAGIGPGNPGDLALDYLVKIRDAMRSAVSR